MALYVDLPKKEINGELNVSICKEIKTINNTLLQKLPLLFE